MSIHVCITSVLFIIIFDLSPDLAIIPREAQRESIVWLIALPVTHTHTALADNAGMQMRISRNFVNSGIIAYRNLASST